MMKNYADKINLIFRFYMDCKCYQSDYLKERDSLLLQHDNRLTVEEMMSFST